MLDRKSQIDDDADATARVRRDPDFQTLVRERTSFGWAMSIVMLGVYLTFIVLSAFGKGFMSSTVGDSAFSWGILLGLFTIVFAFALTGLYVSRANGRFDDLTARLHKGSR